MTPRPTPRRRPVVAITFAALTLGTATIGTVVATGSGASAVPPVADCAVPFPVADIAAGDTVHGLTVVSGTTPVAFTGEVLGVLEDGIAPDLDMIMIKLDMPEFASSGGVWQGMSGSPVYSDADNRLLGAVAYGLAYGASPIAGVTPFEDMDNYLTAAPLPRSAPKPLSKSDAQVIARHSDVSRAQAAQGFSELPMPLGVNGVSARRLAQAQTRGPKWLLKDSYAMGRSGGSIAAGPETIVAGGNLAASASYGDITYAGVGTATSVCDGEVVGFGHPLFGLGATTLGLHPADALYIQPDSLGSPFKVANISAPAGTITQDRTTGITGNFAALPEVTSVVSDVTHGATSRVGSTDVSAELALPDVTFYQLIGNQDRVLDGSFSGSEVLGYTITGDDNGVPFALAFEDRFTSSDLSFDSSTGLADLTYALTSIPGVSIDSIHADSDITDEVTTSRISQVQQRVGGTWKTVTNRSPVKAKPGSTVRLRVRLGGTAGEQILPVAPITIPKKASGSATLLVQGGQSLYTYLEGSSVAALKKALTKTVRHDVISLQLATDNKIVNDGGGDYANFKGKPGKPTKPVSFSVKRDLGPLDHVVSGYKRITVKIG